MGFPAGFEGGEPRLLLSGVCFNCAYLASPPSMRFGLCAWYCFNWINRQRFFAFAGNTINAIKFRVRVIFETSTKIVGDHASKHRKALQGTASPGSANTGLCTVSVLEWISATL
jgi:hypothetical protein